MELFIIRVIFFCGFYGVYCLEEYTYLTIFYILLALSIHLIYMNWSKGKYLLIIEGLVSFAVAFNYPMAIIIASICILEFINSFYPKGFIAYAISYAPIFVFGSIKVVIINLTIISIMNYLTFISERYKKELKEKGKKIEILEKEIYKRNLELKNEKESNKLQIHNLKLEERNKLSGKMHDKIGHVISTVLMQLRATLVIMDSDRDEGEKMIKSSIEVLSDGMNDIRSTLKEIKPAYGEIGINNIKKILDEKLTYSKFKYSFIYKGELEDISINNWNILIDSIRELTTNILKYSIGNKVNIYLEVFNELVKLRVKDNGEIHGKIEKGLGLTSMEEKVISKRGNFIINTHDGFEIVIILKKGEL